jgi:MATE family multidrug resistance protein
MLATLIANLVNIPLSIFLAWGGTLWGGVSLPFGLTTGWGTAGVAWATTLVTILQAAILAWVYLRRVRDEPPPAISWGGMRAIWWLGWPIALQHLAEVGLFVMMTLLMGHFGDTALGGHEIALKIASFTFTMCLGIGQATSVRVGYAVGQRDPIAMRRAGWVGITLGLGLMSLSASLLAFQPLWLASFFTHDRSLLQAAIPFLWMAALFQWVDGIQVVVTGALRGAGDTRTPLLLNLASHWAIGVPLGAWLAFGTSLGALGLWCGLCAGLATISALLSWRFFWISRAADAEKRLPKAR